MLLWKQAVSEPPSSQKNGCFSSLFSCSKPMADVSYLFSRPEADIGRELAGLLYSSYVEAEQGAAE